MADLLKNSNVQSLFSQLGTFVADEYVPSDDCYSKLRQIYTSILNYYLFLPELVSFGCINITHTIVVLKLTNKIIVHLSTIQEISSRKSFSAKTFPHAII